MKTLDDKISHAKHLVFEWGPAGAGLMCSFGKDSMVLLHLAREVLGKDLPVIFYRHPHFPAKWEFADQVIRSRGLTVHDYPPFAAGVKVKPGMLELVARYGFGENGAMDLPINTLAPVPRRNFICGLYDWILRPKAGVITFPWKAVFMGHKSSDVDPFDGAVPLKSDTATIGQTELVFPLRYWTDADVWDYIETHHVPYDKRRYQDRAELADKWLNPDYVHTCTACIDPREKRETVPCPRLGGELVRNMGAQVLRLQQIPEYVGEREEEHAV
jgi:phosphoadenosine phosphosulfate reductase family protein